MLVQINHLGSSLEVAIEFGYKASKFAKADYQKLEDIVYSGNI